MIATDLLICFTGWLIFNIFMLKNDKDKFDDKDQTFSFTNYASKSWDNWIFTLSASIGLLFITPNGGVLPEPLAMIPVPFLKGAFGGLIFQGLYDVVKTLIEKFKKKL